MRAELEVNVTAEADPGVKIVIGSVFNNPHILLLAMDVVYVFDAPGINVSGIEKLATQLESSGKGQLFLTVSAV